MSTNNMNQPVVTREMIEASIAAGKDRALQCNVGHPEWAVLTP